MRHDMHPYERAFSSKEVAEEVWMQHPQFGGMVKPSEMGVSFLKDGE
jgi:hypothetical protein